MDSDQTYAFIPIASLFALKAEPAAMDPAAMADMTEEEMMARMMGFGGFDSTKVSHSNTDVFLKCTIKPTVTNTFCTGEGSVRE